MARCPNCGANLSRQIFIGFGGWGWPGFGWHHGWGHHHGWGGWGNHGWGWHHGWRPKRRY